MMAITSRSAFAIGVVCAACLLVFVTCRRVQPNAQRPLYLPNGGLPNARVDFEGKERRERMPLWQGEEGVAPLGEVDDLKRMKPTTLFGLVEDSSGARVSMARVGVIRLGGSEAVGFYWVGSRTNEIGEFIFDAISVGTYQLSLTAEFGGSKSIYRVQVEEGENNAGTLILGEELPVGSISGVLENAPPTAMVRLKKEDGSWERLVCVESSGPEGDYYWTERGVEVQRNGHHFMFSNVPPGTYEVRPLAEGSLWEPQTVHVSIPTSELSFRRVLRSPVRFVLDVVDSSTGRRLESSFVEMHGSEWYPDPIEWEAGSSTSLEAYDDMRWLVHSPGYQYAELSKRDFVFTSDGIARATASLRKGWNARFVFRDPRGQVPSFDWEGHLAYLRPWESPPVPGVKVYIDGRLIGISDEEGVLEINLPEEPKQIRVEARGCSDFGSAQLLSGRLRDNVREVVYWVSCFS